MTDLSTILARLDANPNAMYSARAVAQMLREATEWRPIETAPKFSQVDIWVNGIGRVCNVRYPDVYCGVTHWMPIPSAPLPDVTEVSTCNYGGVPQVGNVEM